MAITNSKGYKVARLICVTGENNNKFYNMEQINANEFVAKWGRVDVTEKTNPPAPMSEWDATYKDKTKANKKPKPYTDVTHLMTESTTSDGKTSSKSSVFHSDRDHEARKFIEMIMGFANKSVEENYTVSANKVTKIQVDEAQSVLNAISVLMIAADDGDRDVMTSNLNDKLLDLYKIIPRRMKKVQFHLVSPELFDYQNDEKIPMQLVDLKKKELEKVKTMFSDEQDALDVMAGQVSMITNEVAADVKKSKTENDILHALNLDLLPCSAAEIKMIQSKLGGNKGQFVRAYRAHNSKSEASFDKWLKNAKHNKADILWHGSRNENWWSIFQQSLKIRPSNAVLTGAMFGHGIYFADKADKSLGYSSLGGSRWAHGNAGKAILGLYEIHQGNQMIITNHKSEHQSLDEPKMKKKGFDSVYAKGGYDLVNNEYITYNDAQCTIRYLVEVKSR